MRDIDDWMFHFERQVGTRLREYFVKETEAVPAELMERLEELRKAEVSGKPSEGNSNPSPNRENASDGEF